MSRAKKAVLITFIVLFLIVALIWGIILWCFSSGYDPGYKWVYYDELSTIMGDNIVYISNKFCENNQLSVVGIPSGFFMGKPDGDIIGEVEISYNSKQMKNSTDYSTLVQNLKSINYSFCSKEDTDNIPVEIDVSVYTGKNKKINYEYEYGGYEYAKYEKSINKIDYNLKATPKKRTTCRLSLRISIKEDVAVNYTEEQKSARIEQIFKSLVDNIVLYQDL
ncbi:MAG: hypothetical protein K2K24_01280 [Clostridia bacterium]|nr:hypothetical protein [Clostridia bacterium]